MQFNNILLTGGSGKLGSHIINSRMFPNLLSPTRNECDITMPGSIGKYFYNNNIDAIIHCAALARLSVCEADPIKAISTNIIGTCNLVNAVIKLEKTAGKKIRFIHISTDGVYQSAKGLYSENDATIPYSIYGWTKLGAECAVNVLDDYCIIRTRFFDPNNIPFNESATNIITSSISIDGLISAIHRLLYMDFRGTINIGGEPLSDYDRYKVFKKTLSPCTRKSITKNLNFKIAQNASMNIDLWKKINKL